MNHTRRPLLAHACQLVGSDHFASWLLRTARPTLATSSEIHGHNDNLSSIPGSRHLSFTKTRASGPAGIDRNSYLDDLLFCNGVVEMRNLVDASEQVRVFALLAAHQLPALLSPEFVGCQSEASSLSPPSLIANSPINSYEEDDLIRSTLLLSLDKLPPSSFSNIL
jgi:hypothetical protein